MNVAEDVSVFGGNGNRVNCAFHSFLEVRLEFVGRRFRFVGHKAATRKLMQTGVTVGIFELLQVRVEIQGRWGQVSHARLLVSVIHNSSFVDYVNWTKTDGTTCSYRSPVEGSENFQTPIVDLYFVLIFLLERTEDRPGESIGCIRKPQVELINLEFSSRYCIFNSF